jgi:hypothetical protein
MKRHGNLFSKLIDLENLRLAYRDARRGKTWQDTIKRFDRHAEENILEIQRSLREKTFTTSPYKTRIIYEPKKRLIYKLPFNPDRIVQHAFMNIVEPIWDRLFIHESHACRRGKGIHSGSRKVMKFVRRNKYCLKIDISKFYPSVDHDILYDIVQRKIKCRDTLWLVRDIVYSVEGGKNVPIGNYTSQWCGNLYLNELDQFLKHVHSVKDYIRYCDDFCLFHDDKKRLASLVLEIEEFLADRLKLTMSKCDLFPVSRGVDFLGYRHFPDHVLLRKSTAIRIKRRLKKLPGLLAARRITLEQYRSTLASVSGWLKWANTYHLRQSLNIAGLEGILNGGTQAI